jgi:D-serine deaminase-like pyridoxal phosphate-dependent protein
LSRIPDEPTPEESIEAAPARVDHAGSGERLQAAHKRLRVALDGLDYALGRQAARALEQADQIAEYAALQEDRSRLAVELDAAARRTQALDAANGEAARRIERAAAAVRAVLAADANGEA